MAASIVLDSGSDLPFYVSGDEVKGRVRYQCISARPIDRVEVKFWGRLKATIVEKSRYSPMPMEYRDRVCLFEDTVISGGKTTLELGIHNWPFSFKFPTTAASRKLEQWDSKYTERQFPVMVLPPSYHLNARGLLLGHSSFIAYAIVAYVYFSDGKKSPETAEAWLNFVPATGARDIELEGDAQHQKAYNIRAFDLLPESERPKLKRFSLSNPSKPAVRFNITVSIPHYLVPTEPWRLIVNLNILPPQSKDVPVASPPRFLLKSIRIRLNSKVVIRVVRSAEHIREIRDDDKAGVSFQNMGVISPGERKEIAMGKLKYLPTSVDLSSFRRQYKVLLELEVETADHAHSFSLKCKEPVTVGPLPTLAREEGLVDATLRAGLKGTLMQDAKLAVGLGTTILTMISG